jgi:hypothetical protein
VRRLVLHSRRRSRPQEEDQDPVEEEQDPVGGISFSEAGEALNSFHSVSKDGSWTFKTTMPRKGKDQTFDELVVQLGLQNRKYASSQWYKFKLDKGFVRPQALTQMQLDC